MSEKGLEIFNKQTQKFVALTNGGLMDADEYMNIPAEGTSKTEDAEYALMPIDHEENFRGLISLAESFHAGPVLVVSGINIKDSLDAMIDVLKKYPNPVVLVEGEGFLVPTENIVTLTDTIKACEEIREVKISKPKDNYITGKKLPRRWKKI